VNNNNFPLSWLLIKIAEFSQYKTNAIYEALRKTVKFQVQKCNMSWTKPHEFNMVNVRFKSRIFTLIWEGLAKVAILTQPVGFRI
jgi:predicted sulfurtransferase